MILRAAPSKGSHPPVRVEIGRISFRGLPRRAALRTAESFERNLSSLIAEHGVAGLGERADAAGAAPNSSLTIRLHRDPEKIGRDLAIAVYRRIWP